MKKTTLGVGALAIILGVTSIFPIASFAYKGDPAVKGPNCSPERHEAMLQAFENLDYDAWANLMQDRGRVTEIVTRENFAKFAEAHKLMAEGNLEGAKQIREELGLGMRNGSGRGAQRNK